MLSFDEIKAKVKSGLSKFTGQKDFLEAVCAASALVAAADGEVSDSELKATSDAVTNHPTLSKSFKGAEIGKCIDSMLARAKQGRMGRMGLYKEIEDVATSPDKSEAVYLCALDIAESDGKIAPEEVKVLSEIANRLGIKASSYMNV